MSSSATQDSRRSSGAAAAADIGTLSKIALQETTNELSTLARKTSSASSTAWWKFRLGAERSLGIEINVEDPALRKLFGHVLQVETLLAQVRANGEALLNGASSLADGSDGATGGVGLSQTPTSAPDAPKPLADSLNVLAQACRRHSAELTGSGGTSMDVEASKSSFVPSGVATAISDAFWNTLSASPNANECHGSARYRMERRLNEEVFEVVDKQIAQHERIREQFRERQQWKQVLEHYQWEVAAKQKQSRAPKPPSSGLRPLANLDDGDAEDRMREAQLKVASIDADVLGQLLDIQTNARRIVAAPWVTLARIRAEFFGALAAGWAPVATTLAEGLDTGSHTSNAARDIGTTASVGRTAPIEVVAGATVAPAPRSQAEAKGDSSLAPAKGDSSLAPAILEEVLVQSSQDDKVVVVSAAEAPIEEVRALAPQEEALPLVHEQPIEALVSTEKLPEFEVETQATGVDRPDPEFAEQLPVENDAQVQVEDQERTNVDSRQELQREEVQPQARLEDANGTQGMQVDGDAAPLAAAEGLRETEADPAKVQQILKFLQHPKGASLRSMPVDQAKQLLTSKGMTEADIEEAFRQLGAEVEPDIPFAPPPRHEAAPAESVHPFASFDAMPGEAEAPSYPFASFSGPGSAEALAKPLASSDAALGEPEALVHPFASVDAAPGEAEARANPFASFEAAPEGAEAPPQPFASFNVAPEEAEALVHPFASFDAAPGGAEEPPHPFASSDVASAEKENPANLVAAPANAVAARDAGPEEAEALANPPTSSDATSGEPEAPAHPFAYFGAAPGEAEAPAHPFASFDAAPGEAEAPVHPFAFVDAGRGKAEAPTNPPAPSDAASGEPEAPVHPFASFDAAPGEAEAVAHPFASFDAAPGEAEASSDSFAPFVAAPGAETPGNAFATFDAAPGEAEAPVHPFAFVDAGSAEAEAPTNPPAPSDAASGEPEAPVHPFASFDAAPGGAEAVAHPFASSDTVPGEPESPVQQPFATSDDAPGEVDAHAHPFASFDAAPGKAEALVEEVGSFHAAPVEAVAPQEAFASFDSGPREAQPVEEDAEEF